MTTEIVESWYTTLIEDLQDLLVETEFTSRRTLIEGYHSLGSRILNESNNFNRASIYGQDIVQRVAQSLNRKPRTIYYAIQFAKTYPDLNLLPDGKNVSWHHVVNKYLTDGTEKKTIKKSDLYRMIKEIKELLEHQWLENHQIEVTFTNPLNSFRDKGEFIRYLQDQVNKITEGI